MKILLKFLVAGYLSLAAISQAADVKQQSIEGPNADRLDKAKHSEFLRHLKQLFPNVSPDSIKASPIGGLYEVVIGPRVYYMSPDARYLVPANIIDLKSGVNLTKPVLHKARNKALEQIGQDNMVIFSPEKPEYTVSVFTDIDCVYCRKMHSEIQEYNKLGIAIRYLFFPRAGMGSESYKTAMSVWCSDDRKQTFSDAKAGKKIPFKECDNPIMKHMLLVQQLELRGTPALMLPSGDLIESYIPPAQMLKALRSDRSK